MDIVQYNRIADTVCLNKWNNCKNFSFMEMKI